METLQTTTATPEWHFYCPVCERSSMARMQKLSDEKWITRCADCETKYEVIPSVGVVENFAHELTKEPLTEALNKHNVMASLPHDCYIRTKIGCHCTDKCGYAESFSGNEP